MTTQTSAEERKKLLEDLDALDLEGEENIPSEVSGYPDNVNVGDNSKAASAFKQHRVMLKSAKGMIAELSARNKELEEQAPPNVEQTPIAQGTFSPVQQTQVYLSNLHNRAMQKMGVFDANNPLVQMEAQRLYTEDMGKVEGQATAEQSAKLLIEDTFSQFPQLSADDKKVLEERISTHDVFEQANSEIVKSEVHKYLGENLDRFQGSAGEPSSNGKPPSGVSPGAAATSSLKSQGSKGVDLGKGPSDNGSTPKPPSPEELKEMKALRIPPEQVALFRRAKKKKPVYDTGPSL